MVRFLTVLLCIVCLVETASAQIKNAGVSFSAKSTKSRTKTASWRSSYSGSTDKSFDRAMLVDMVLRNMKPDERVFTVEVTFVGKTLRSKTLYRFSDFSEEVLLKGRGSTNLQAESEAVSSREAKYTYYYNNSKYVAGSKIEGFIARVKDADDKLLAIVASSSTLEKIGKDEKLLQKLIDADPKDK